MPYLEGCRKSWMIKIQAKFAQEKIAILYHNAIQLIPVNIILITFVCFACYDKIPFTYLINIWLMVTFVALLRLMHIVYVVKFKAIQFQEKYTALERRFTLGAACSGLSWGLSYLILTRYLPIEYHYLILLIIAGLISGSLITLSTSTWAFIVYLISMIIAPIVSFSMLKTPLGTITAIVIIFYFIAMLVTFYRSQQLVSKNLLLRLTKEKLIDQLHESNTQLHVFNQKIINISYTDELTQLANRRFFMKKLEEEWKRCHRSHSHLSVLMLDVDHFKKYNDDFGHIAGDTGLQQLAEILRFHICRPHDVIARYGGEEFVALLPETPLSGAIHVAELIQQDLHKANMISGTNRRITVSIGIASHQLHNSTINAAAFLKQADINLYKAKNSGRDMIVSR